MVIEFRTCGQLQVFYPLGNFFSKERNAEKTGEVIKEKNTKGKEDINNIRREYFKCNFPFRINYDKFIVQKILSK